MQFFSPGLGDAPGAQYPVGGTTRPRVVKVYGAKRSRFGVVVAVTFSGTARTKLDWAPPGEESNRKVVSDSVTVMSRRFKRAPSRVRDIAGAEEWPRIADSRLQACTTLRSRS
jgi:hypothetical protein